jgi:Bacterial Ig-like domain
MIARRIRRRVGRFCAAVTVLSMLVGMLGMVPAFAAGAVGPNAAFGPDNSSFPQWYEDANGVRLDMCLDDPNCVSLSSQLTAPAGEAFYTLTNNDVIGPGVNGFVETAVEAAFLDAGAGQEITFGRVRMRFNVTSPGTFTVTYPYGAETFSVPAVGNGLEINFTDDIGCPAVPCNFADALTSPVLNGFIRWDPAVAPAAPAGYLGDGATPHAVTGSPTLNNFVRVDGPNAGGSGVNTFQSDLFTVEGKIATGSIARPSLLAADDSGASNADRITNVTTPRITGAATPGATVKIYSDAALVGTGTADGAGSYTIATSALANGTHAITATQTVGADPEGAPSPALSITIDALAPAAPSLTGTDPASPANNNNPKVKGSAEAGSSVRLFTDAACTAVAATGTAADLGGAGIPVTVADNTTTTYFATATDVAGNASACSISSVTYVENTAPSVTAPTTALRKARSTTAVPVTVKWTGSGTITSYTLERSVNGGPFQAVSLASPTSTSFNDQLAPGSTYQYRATAKNGSITGTPQTGAAVQAVVIDHNSPSITLTGSWSKSRDTWFSSTAGSTAKVTFNGGTSVGWVSQKASTRGTADVTVDGAFAETVNLAAGIGSSGTVKKNQVVSVQPLTGVGPTHTMTIKVDLNKRVDIDAFVVLR